MTAINIIRLEESVHMFTDMRAGVGGVQVGQLVKCLPLPHLAAAVATRGDAAVLTAIHRTASQFSDFATLKAGIIREVQSVGRLTPFDIEKQALAGQWDAFVIGWGSTGPEAFGFFSHAGHGYPAFTIYEVPGVVVTPVIPEQVLGEVMALENYIAIGMGLMEIQRHIYPTLVGGPVIETWVDADGVHTRRLIEREAFR